MNKYEKAGLIALTCLVGGSMAMILMAGLILEMSHEHYLVATAVALLLLSMLVGVVFLSVRIWKAPE